MTKKREEDLILDQYAQIARVLGAMFCPMLEVVVHDLRKPSQSIIFIVNGHITGRKVGDGTSDLGIRRITKGDVPDELINYHNETPEGLPLKSSSIAIKNKNGRILGSLCFNLALSTFIDFHQIIGKLVACNDEVRESFHPFGKSAETLREMIRSSLVGRTKNGRALSVHNRRKLIQQLHEQGCFEARAAVTLVARELGISRPTLYADLKEISGGTTIS